MLDYSNKLFISSNILKKVNFDEISSMLGFHFNFDFKIVIDCPDEIFKKLLNITIYLIVLENAFLKSQIYDKLVTM